MTQRPALIMAAALTAFVLVLLGSLALFGTQPPASTAVSPAAPSADLPPPTASGAGTAAPLPDRAAAYQQALQDTQAQLAEATRRLAQANAQLSQAYAQPTPTLPLPTPPAPPPTPPHYAVSAERAAQVALAAAPGRRLAGSPDLVRYQGSVAYEIPLDRGTVYVDANTGQVLYNGARAVVPPAGAPAPPGGYDDDDYEPGGDN